MAKNEVEILISAKDKASSVFSSLTAKLGAVAAAVAGYFGVTFLSDAIKGAADLEQGLSRIQAASGASATEMDALKKAATDAGATTKFTATEAAGALENLTKAGLSAKDSIAALPAVLSLAQAGDIGLAESSTYLTQTIKGLGLEFTDSARVADVLAKGANASSTSVTGLAQALSYAAPVAKAANLSLEETVAIIGKFADGGIDASRAGTALNSILAQFIDPASKYRSELAGIGIVTSDFGKSLRQLAAAGEKGQQAILAVGLESGPALRTLLNQGMGALDELKGKLDASAGSASATAAVMEGNLKGSFGGLASAWDTVKIALGEPVLPVLTSAVKQLTAGISDAVSNGTIGRFGTVVATAFQSAIEWVQGFVAAVDFKAVAAQLQDFAVKTGDAMTQVGQKASEAGNVVKLVYGVMSGGVNSVLSAVYALGGGFAGVAAGIQRGLAELYEAASKVTFGNLSRQYKEIASEIRLSADATTASAKALGQKSQQAFDAAANAGQMAKTAYLALATSASASVPAQNASAAAIGSVAVQLEKMAEANAKASLAATQQKQAVEQTTQAVAKLKTEYEAAMAAGDIQLAAQKQQELRDQLAKTGAQGKLTADELKALFNGLGVVSQASLKQSADAAQTLFNQLKSSGQATALDLQNAFSEVAKRTLAAAGDVGSVGRAAAESTLKARAAAEGLSIEFDNTGRAIVRAMGQGGSAVDNLTQKVTDSTAEFAKQAAALDAIYAKYGQSKADYEFKYGKVGGDPTKTSDGFAKNKDGSASGTFTNNLDTSAASELIAKSKAGKLTAADLESAKAAFKQAQNALDYMQAMGKLNPGGQTFDYVQSTQALFVAARTAYEQVQAMAGKPFGGAAAAKPQGAATAAGTPAPAPTPASPAPATDVQAALLAAARAQFPGVPGNTAAEVSLNAANQAAAAARPNTAAQTSVPAPTPSNSSQTVLVKIDLGGGKSFDVNTASAGDASQLQNFIGALQNAKRAAGM